MTDGASTIRPLREESDISIIAVWIACAIICLVLVALAQTAPHIIAGDAPTTEQGVMEQLQNLTLAIALLMALWLAFKADTPALRGWAIIIALGTFFLLGEEASWGQHYFGWETSGVFAEINDQGETNLHNTEGGWFDQKPRALLLFGMILGTIVHPLVKLFRNGRGLFDNPWWLAPTLASLPPVVFSQIGALPERLDDFDDMIGVFPYSFQELANYRSSEMEEVFMYVFFVTYLLSLLTRLRRHKEASSA